MIYRKDANFPYPIISNTSTAYQVNDFELVVRLQENNDTYRFYIEYEIGSGFIKKVINNQQAQLMLVVQSKDNKFFNLDVNQSYIEISKTRISLSKRTKVQLLIMAKEDMCFKDNDDLDKFYREVKERLFIPKYSILGYSDVAIFEGSYKKPLELVERRLNPELKSDINIVLGSETIVINYKNENLQFVDSPKCNQLNHHYVYMGLQKALYRFIFKYGEDEEVILGEIEPPEDGLDFKLYNLMISKMIETITLDNVDEVIYKITDKIIEKHVSAIKGLYTNGN